MFVVKKTRKERLKDNKLIAECVELLNKKLEKHNLEIEVLVNRDLVSGDHVELAILEKTKPLKTDMYRMGLLIHESIGELFVGERSLFIRAKLFRCGEVGTSRRFDDVLDFLEKFDGCNSLEELKLRLEVEGR